MTGICRVLFRPVHRRLHHHALHRRLDADVPAVREQRVEDGPPAPDQRPGDDDPGRQPAPDYPWRAQREGQEGTVTVRFTVSEEGRVLAAEAVKPCPWNMLNEAAVRVIKERWRFVTGPIRLYEVSIRFQLTK